jgi:hypothetical protein
MQGAHVAYVGFKSIPSAREYTFRVIQADGTSHDFHIAVSNDAFLSRNVRYQDAAEICFLKLQRALIACEPGQLPVAQALTAGDFEEYRLAHAARTPARRLGPPVPRDTLTPPHSTSPRR